MSEHKVRVVARVPGLLPFPRYVYTCPLCPPRVGFYALTPGWACDMVRAHVRAAHAGAVA